MVLGPQEATESAQGREGFRQGCARLEVSAVSGGVQAAGSGILQDEVPELRRDDLLHGKRNRLGGVVLMRAHEDIAAVRFRGSRYRNHAMDAIALRELVRFLDAVSATVKENWLWEHPGKGKLPPAIKESTQLVVPSIRKGSAEVGIQLRRQFVTQLSLFGDPKDSVRAAVDCPYRVYQAVKKDSVFPERSSKNLLTIYARFGTSLPADHSFNFAPLGKDFIEVTEVDRRQLAHRVITSYEEEIDLRGTVVALDLKTKKFKLESKYHGIVVLEFNDDQVQTVIDALVHRNSIEIQVKGLGIFDMKGILTKFTNIETFEAVETSGVQRPSAPERVDKIIEEVFKDVPDGEWDKLPNDLTDRIDDYIYERGL